MYGRCETDPFDQATDVCDSCYGEFCSACMVKPKRRKHPICRECAIIASGVRPGAKPLLRGSKKTAAERRKALQDAPVAARAFEYFDDDPDLGTAADEHDRIDAEPETEPLPANATVDAASDGADDVEDDVELEIDVVDIEARLGAGVGAEAPVETGDPPPAEPTSEPPAATEPTATGVTPGLAALAKHQADRRPPTVAPESVPAPDWLTEPVAEAAPSTPTQPTAGGPSSTAPADGAPIVSDEAVEPARALERPPTGEKPVTDGYDWVTKMPPRGASTPLPSRSGNGAAKGREPSPTGGVATADRPKPALPKRRSKLRPTVDS